MAFGAVLAASITTIKSPRDMHDFPIPAEVTTANNMPLIIVMAELTHINLDLKNVLKAFDCKLVNTKPQVRTTDSTTNTR